MTRRKIPSKSYVLLLLTIDIGLIQVKNEQNLEMTKQLFYLPCPVQRGDRQVGLESTALVARKARKKKPFAETVVPLIRTTKIKEELRNGSFGWAIHQKSSW
jgi:hypothetical protein